ncbi:calcium-translocating P-type ATPase, PMCA-type [Niastella populi]|uniref:P-type Ca(2+) transporter n=1 Tax=Niastella populi TaxID=550983 RepID=A0A1V9FN70_9BACT|nr:calcium-translocating P-type ATPase, PMCA-type [Niastella populi]OQP59778.1 calcium-translocating P-type ATPase, PMCA-type [Niastella populi]
MNWHTSTFEAVLKELQSSKNGLTTDEVAQRMQQYGPNQLQEKKKKPVWLLFVMQFKDVMILILMVAAIISAVVGDLKDMIVILFIIIINAIVGFVQEYRAEKAIDALKKMSAANVRVRRNKRVEQIAATEVVPGDVVLLEAGDMVGADLRIIESHSLKIEEASLTGESQAVNKSPDAIKEEEVPLGDRVNMAYKSTLVTAGNGTGVVVATGMQTEIGKIAGMLQEKEATTPLQQRLADFSKKLSFIVLGICVVLYFIGILRGETPANMLLTTISLAVAAIPEALPAVITIALALGAKKLVRKNALIRKLPAVETLGSVTYICTDKTGTLTQNQMTVQEIWQYEQWGLTIPEIKKEQAMLLVMSLNHDAKEDQTDDNKLKGDPTEVALVEYALQQEGYNNRWENDFPRRQELPFDSDRKMMTTVHAVNDEFLVITKGALEAVLNICESADEEEISAKSDKLAEAGQRIIAYSCKLIQQLPKEGDMEALESDQEFCGLAGMIDPPRPEARQAITECKTAGIVPVMITGDHPITASAIARDMGILQHRNDRTVTGIELEKLSDEALDSEITQIKVYARVSPQQKLRIVKTLQKKDQFVAMTGDGVNDAPALKRANIGVAMGITGTDVSKEAADMILLDDNFATIVKAVREGRRIYDNIRRFIRYVLACNFAEILTIFIAPLVGMPIPLLPIHILWINLVTDSLPGLALAGEKADVKVMERPPRDPKESIFAMGLGFNVIWVGVLMAAVGLVTQAWSIHIGDAHWQTMVFTVLCFSQMGHALVSRSEHEYIFRIGVFTNRNLIGAIALTFILQIAIIYMPFLNKIFNTEPLTWKELGTCLLISTITFHAVELEKFIKKRMGTI